MPSSFEVDQEEAPKLTLKLKDYTKMHKIQKQIKQYRQQFQQHNIQQTFTQALSQQKPKLKQKLKLDQLQLNKDIKKIAEQNLRPQQLQPIGINEDDLKFLQADKSNLHDQTLEFELKFILDEDYQLLFFAEKKYNTGWINFRQDLSQRQESFQEFYDQFFLNFYQHRLPNCLKKTTQNPFKNIEETNNFQIFIPIVESFYLHQYTSNDLSYIIIFLIGSIQPHQGLYCQF